jgi:acetylornithine deacetylase
VNAIEKAEIVLEAIRSLRSEWASREGLEHAYLSRPAVLPTMARSGEWPVTYPASCDLTIATMYLPVQADQRRWGSAVRLEVEEWIARACAQDDWLASHPPVIEWWPNAVMPHEIDPSEPIVQTMLGAAKDVGQPGRLAGLDSWFDGAALTQLGGIPTIGYGPPGLDAKGTSVAHVVDEYVPIDGLVACAQGLAIAGMRFCESVCR